MNKNMNKDIKIEYVAKSTEFVGIKIMENKVELRVPQVFRKDDTYKKDILLFLKSISIAKTIDKENIRRGSNVIKNIWPFDSYLWIIKDYIENGCYYNREKVYSINNGKIEWKKTIKNTPIYSNGNLIYDKFVTSKMSATNDVIAQIYQLCLKQSIDKIGWLFNYDIHIDVQQLISTKEMIYRIKNELNSTFDDTKRLRFNHLLKILINSEGDNIISKSYSYGIENYYYVYEKMIDSFFDGVEGDEKKKYDPNGYWKLNNKGLDKASSLRPDTILRKDDKTYILDAKMYQYGATHSIRDLPDTQSMQKQITYGDYVYNVLKDKNVRNVFILPYNKELIDFKEDYNAEYYLDENLAYIGYAYVDWRDDEEYLAHDLIHTFLIDFNYLLRRYRYKDNEVIDKLCEEIEGHLEI